jgi:thioredoxin-dependent peroxiredoxin
MHRASIVAPTVALALGLLATALPAQASAQASQGVGKPTAILITGPREGDRAPDFSLPYATKDGIGTGPWFGITPNRGKVVVLAFYPKDFTSGCTAELKTFTERFDDMFGEGVELVGISADSLETHVRFAQSLDMPFKLLSDPDQKVSKQWGSAGDNGYNRRTVFVIDKQGKVVYADRRFGALDPKAYDNLKTAVQGARSGA